MKYRSAVFVAALFLVSGSIGFGQVSLAKYSQTSPNPPSVSTENAIAFAVSFTPRDCAAGSLVYPGPGSPAPLTFDGLGTLSRQDKFPSKAALDAAYRLGINLTGGTLGPQSPTLDLTQDLYPGRFQI